MDAVERKPAEAVTVKEFLTRATTWIKSYWVSGSYYQSDNMSNNGVGPTVMEEGGHAYVNNLGNIFGVCSVGAMRVAFAEIVALEPDGTDQYGEWWFESKITQHPLYQEGMRILGKAFYEMERPGPGEMEVQDYLANEMDPDMLLNGTEGHSYTIGDVEQAVINLNDSGHWDGDWFADVFARAAALAPDKPLQMA